MQPLFLRIALLTLTLIAWAVPAAADDAETLRALAANRRLLAAAYLEKDSAMIRVLEADTKRLLGGLPAEARAQEFLKDLAARKRAVAKGPSEEAAPFKDDLRDMHEQALALVEQDRFLEAAALYESIVLIDAEDDEAYLLMGHTYMLSGEFLKAEEAFQNAVHIDPENRDEIVPFYENVMIRSPGDDTAHVNLGAVRMILGDDAGALRAFEDALAINPENKNARQGLEAVRQRSSPR